MSPRESLPDFLALLGWPLTPMQRAMLENVDRLDQMILRRPPRFGSTDVHRLLGVFALLRFYGRCRQPQKVFFIVDEAVAFERGRRG